MEEEPSAINHVPTGQYVAVIVSENTTDGNWFNASDKKTFYTNRSKRNLKMY